MTGAVEPLGEAEPTTPAAVVAPPHPPWWQAAFHLTIIVALALGVFCFQLGHADWEDDSESCGGQIMQEMVSGNGWVLPLRNGVHIPVKPPLFYWAGAVSAVLRHSEVDFFDARVPSAVFATALLMALYVCVRAAASAHTALWATVILITTPQFLIEARNSRVDMTFCVFVTLALLFVHRVWEGRAGARTALAAGVCLGLAVLTKGPLAIALVVLVMVVTAVFAAPAPGWTVLLRPAVVGLALGVPALWYLAATVEHGREFLQIHFYSENVSRLLGEQGHWPVWWYIEPLITGGLPWTLALPFAVRGESTVPSRSRRFLWVWTVAMFVFFSLSPGKRRAYLIVIRPALAIVIAGWLVPQFERARAEFARADVPRRLHIGVAVITALAVAVIFALRAGIGGFGASEITWAHWWREYLQREVVWPVAMIATVAVAAELIAYWGSQRRLEPVAWVITGAMAVCVTIGVSAGAIVRGAGASFAPLARRISQQVKPGEPLAFLGVDDDAAIALLFHLRRHVEVIAPHATEPVCTPPHPGWYLIYEKQWDERLCFRDAPWHAVERGGPSAKSQRWRRLVLARYSPAGT